MFAVLISSYSDRAFRLQIIAFTVTNLCSILLSFVGYKAVMDVLFLLFVRNAVAECCLDGAYLSADKSE